MPRIGRDYAYAGQSLTWAPRDCRIDATWVLWTPLAMAGAGQGERVPVVRGARLRGLAVHVPLSLAVTVVKVLADVVIGGALTGVARPPANPLALYTTFGTYWAILGVSSWLSARRVAAERELRAVRLDPELTRARVQALESQLHPHFLSTTLKTVSGLRRENVEAADSILTRLSELLR